MGSPSLNVALQLINLLGDELTEIQTSSTPSLSITDHPSSASPTRVSLKPLKQVRNQLHFLLKQIHDKKHLQSACAVQEPDLVSFWLRARKAAGCLPHPVITE